MDNTAPIWGLGGLIVGAWVGSRFGVDGYGRGRGVYDGGYGGEFGHGAWERERQREQFCFNREIEKRQACTEAHLAAVDMAEKKDAYWEQKMERAQDQIVDGKIFRATCRKPDGKVFLSPSHLANAYRGESRILDSHPEGHEFRNDEFGFGCEQRFF